MAKRYTKKSKYISHPDRKYYIFESDSKVFAISDYKFSELNHYLKLLVEDEHATEGSIVKQNPKLNAFIKRMGFDWDPLSEAGHMRQFPYAVAILSSIEKYIWAVVSEFCEAQKIPLYRISGGELVDADQANIKKQLALIMQNLMYGTNIYNVAADNHALILRYSACLQKLSVLKNAELKFNDFPIGIFEVSKSYRFENTNELQLCKRVRSFRLPELHIVNDSLAISLERAYFVHVKILEEIKKFDEDYEILCSVTHDFFKNNVAFLNLIVQTIKRPIVLSVYNEGVNCENGIKIDVEYKTFDTVMKPVEIATFQVDEGDTPFAFDLNYKTKSGISKAVSTIHAVFPFSSLERTVYFFLDRAVKNELSRGFFSLPFWMVPVQARIIPNDDRFNVNAKEIGSILRSENFKAEIDDRMMTYNSKKDDHDLKWIPYIITVGGQASSRPTLGLEHKTTGLKKENIKLNEVIKILKNNENQNIVDPQFMPAALSERLF